ncbi:DUF3048 domain-containing protein [Bacillus sp. V33-4]|uniref:DUF3048 domain-containing protein n=1 Tax=Bacillus sp. V33-4 TaxID=2054169 RepID=UPI000C7858BF|nr:DUF3048 domain-containing protein [Bacillus sp. V33-4]PLR86497.1 DUF3048 domain-containing protein [Bacillus sp. V33-4]
MLKKSAVLAASLLLLFSGCSNKEEVKDDVKKAADKTVKEVVAETSFSEYYPLTGIGSEEATDGRAVAVMVNNHPAARPQSGLNKADIVYEVLAEGGVTRLLAIFQSEKPENIGPVRSAREYYIELAKGYDSLFIAHGYSPDAKSMLDKGYIDHLNGMAYDGTLFQRADFRKAPHNSYITFGNIMKGAEENLFPMNESPGSLQFYTEKELDTISGEDAQSAMISYSSEDFNSSYEYDDQLGKYKRYSSGEQTVDYVTEEPVLIDNIFIVETEHAIVDDAGRREIDLTSGGRALLLQKGKRKEVEWKNVDGKILPFIAGSAAPLVPGKTWINIVPTDPGIEQSVSFETESI